MVFYQQQNVALLAQISKQISSIAPQVSIPSIPLPSYDFSPSASDVRVNSFWFMSLVFSLSAALLATLVQQWVRDYMHVFQRYSNPLKSARLRQYLYEGVEEWYMPMVARSVPGLVHVSLFLFFLGLCDSHCCIHNCRRHYYHSDCHMRVAVRLEHVFSDLKPPISISKPILWPDVVSEAEGTSATLFGSRIWWISQGCELEHV